MLRSALEVQTGAGSPPGCLSVISTMACGTEAEGVKAEVIARRASSELALIQRFERARVEGDLPAGLEPAALVRYLLAIIQGMAVQAGSGVPRERLAQIVSTALQLWPSA